MANNIVTEGSVIQWTNGTGSTKASGAVVVIGSNGDALIGIAAVDIANGATGSVIIDEAVATVPKVSGAVIAQGEYVIWDASAGAFDDNAATPATGDVSDGAIAWESAGNGVTSIKVKLIGKPGVLA
jgi:predicted RecA/RadA family phage recombinase